MLMLTLLWSWIFPATSFQAAVPSQHIIGTSTDETIGIGKDVQREILGVLVGAENAVNLSHGGTSKSSINKANATTSIAANALTKMLTSKDPSSYAMIQQNLSMNAAKRAPPACITPPPPPPPPPQEMTANGEAAGATSRARELLPNAENSEHESSSSNQQSCSKNVSPERGLF
jgi:hypothetical protein